MKLLVVLCLGLLLQTVGSCGVARATPSGSGMPLLAQGTPVPAPPDEARNEAGADTTRPKYYVGLLVDPETAAEGQSPIAYEFRFHPDSGVAVRDLGRIPFETGPFSGMPELPPSDGTELRMSVETFLIIADSFRDMIDPQPASDVIGYSIEDGQLRVKLSRGISVVAAVVLAVSVLVVASLIVVIVRLRRERRRTLALAMAARYQAEAREAERVRIAREIHDGPIQDLHAVRAGLYAAPGAPSGTSEDTTSDSATAAGATAAGATAAGASTPEAVSDAVTAIARELRAIAEDLRPPALSRFGLSAALEAHAARFRERNPGVKVRLFLDDDSGPQGSAFSESARVALFRVAQEAMTNAVRHGGAGRIEVELRFEPQDGSPEWVHLDVHDDGRGLPSAAPPDLARLAEGGHFGLTGIQERAALLGGRFTIQPRAAVHSGDGAPAPATGTTAHFAVPWEAVSEHDPTSWSPSWT